MTSIATSFGGLNAEMRLPDDLPDPGLLVGWSLEAEHRRHPVGFGFGDPAKTPASGWLDPVLLSGEGHLISIAPTGTGKGRGCIIPALLRHEGPVIVIDPKGENVAVTARRRREMGQQIVVLDPMGITDEKGGCFNPLDLIEADSVDSVDLASMFADALVDGKGDERNAYWYQRAVHMLTGLMLHTATQEDKARRTFATIRHMLARVTEEQGGVPLPGTFRYDILNSPHPEARQMASMLGSTASEGLGSIISMAQDGVDFLRGPLVQAATARTSFDLAAVTRGDPLSIYLVLPPHMMESHARLLRMWIMALLSLITRRRGKPDQSTLLILDEAAQLGTLPQLRQAITLLRGYGVQSWSFWQDVSQMRRLYPDDWETMVNNCRVVQCFGALNLMAAGAMAKLTGFGSESGREVLDLDDHEMLLQIAGDEAVVARKPDYLTDPAFRGQFDANPYHDPAQDVVPPPPARLKLHARGERNVAATPPGASEELALRIRAQVDAARRDTKAEVTEPEAEVVPNRLLGELLRKWGA